MTSAEIHVWEATAIEVGITKVKTWSFLCSWHGKSVESCVMVQGLCTQHIGFCDETDWSFLLPPSFPGLLTTVGIQLFVGLFSSLDSWNNWLKIASYSSLVFSLKNWKGEGSDLLRAKCQLSCLHQKTCTGTAVAVASSETCSTGQRTEAAWNAVVIWWAPV